MLDAPLYALDKDSCFPFPGKGFNIFNLKFYVQTRSKTIAKQRLLCCNKQLELAANAV